MTTANQAPAANGAVNGAVNGSSSAGGTTDSRPALRSVKTAAVPPGRRSVFEDGGRPESSRLSQQRVEQGRQTVTSTVAPTTATVPSLPEFNPVMAPSVAEPANSGPTATEMNALRSAQARASRQQRQGKVFGRSMLAVILIAGLVAGALMFGRSLLFPTEWDARLTPIVSEIETARGGEFAEPVTFVRVDSVELARRATESSVGDEWVSRVPEWRALGLASGDPTVESVGAAILNSSTTWYDPTTNTLYALGEPDPAVDEATGDDAGVTDETVAPAIEPVGTDAAVVATDDDLRIALETVFDRQARAGEARPDLDSEAGFPTPSAPASLARRSVDQFLISGAATDRSMPAGALPVPIAYELAAVAALGGPIVEAAGVDAATLTPGTDYPEAVDDALDVELATIDSALLRAGDVPLVDPTAVGNDAWSLVWGARLPADTVQQLVDTVTADSYRAYERGGVVCVTGVFETANRPGADSVEAAITTWAAAAPANSLAVAARVSPTIVQFDACDPGVEAPIVSNTAAAGGLVARQIERLSE